MSLRNPLPSMEQPGLCLGSLSNDTNPSRCGSTTLTHCTSLGLCSAPIQTYSGMVTLYLMVRYLLDLGRAATPLREAGLGSSGYQQGNHARYTTEVIAKLKESTLLKQVAGMGMSPLQITCSGKSR